MLICAIGFSVRALCQAIRRCGYPVTAIDHFNDFDTCAETLDSLRISWPRSKDLGPAAPRGEESAWKEVLEQIDACFQKWRRLHNWTPPITVAAGGIENHPELVDYLHQSSTFLGPTSPQVSQLRSPWTIRALALECGLGFPPSYLQQPRPVEDSADRCAPFLDLPLLATPPEFAPLDAKATVHYQPANVRAVTDSRSPLSKGPELSSQIPPCGAGGAISPMAKDLHPGWIIKPLHSGGGLGIRRFPHSIPPHATPAWFRTHIPSQHYLQQVVPGRPLGISLLVTPPTVPPTTPQMVPPTDTDSPARAIAPPDYYPFNSPSGCSLTDLSWVPQSASKQQIHKKGWRRLTERAGSVGGWHQMEAMIGGWHQVEAAMPLASFPVLPLAAGEFGAILGATESWRAEDWPGPSEFVYRGSFGPVSLEPAAVCGLLRMCEILHKRCGYVGWLGVDGVLDASGHLWVLELNPRWTAGMEILGDCGLNPVAWHLDAWGESIRRSSGFSEAGDGGAIHVHFDRRNVYQISQVAAKAVVYAPHDVRVCRHQWEQLTRGNSGRFADLPAWNGSHDEALVFREGEPILTVKAVVGGDRRGASGGMLTRASMRGSLLSRLKDHLEVAANILGLKVT